MLFITTMAALLVAGIGPGTATAPNDLVTIEWNAPDACPTGEDVRKRAMEILQPLGPLEEGPRAPVYVAGKVVRTDDDKFELALRLGGQPDDVNAAQPEAPARVLQASRCSDLVDAAALIVAIAVDPRVLEQAEELTSPQPNPPDPPPIDPEPKAAPPEPKPEPEPEPEPAPAPESPRLGLHLDLQVEGGAALGILPELGGVVGGGFGLGGQRWRTELVAQYWTPSRTTATDNEAVGGRFQLWTIVARGCYVPSTGDIGFPLCALVEAGAMEGRGTGELTPRSARSLWSGAGAGAAVLYRPAALDRRLGLMVRAEGFAALTRPSFGTTARTVYQGGVGGGRFMVAFVVRLADAKSFSRR